MDQTAKRNKDLDERLRNVYVTSNNVIPDNQSETKCHEKPLPIKRTTDFFELGYKESKIIPVGRVSLMQAMKFITDHRSNSSEWTVEKIANEYRLNMNVVGM